MVKIVFAGDIGSPFIKGDADIMREISDSVFVVETPISIVEAIKYSVSFFSEDIFSEVYKCDLVWIWFADVPAVPLILLAKLFNKKVFVNVGDFEVAANKEIGFGNQLKFVRGWISRWVLRNSDCLITPSNYYVRDIMELSEGCDIGTRVSVVPCSIDTSLCDAALPDKERAAVTTYCRRGLEARKGIDVFRDVKKTHRDFEMEEYLALPRVQYLDLLKRSKVYCYLGFGEAFGIAAVEAMALGCVPVVSSKAGAIVNIVGDSGVVVDCSNIGNVRDGIERAMNMDCSAARARAREFSRNNRKEKIVKLVASVMEVPEVESC